MPSDHVIEWVCDFCHQPVLFGTWHDVADFSVSADGTIFNSSGGWLACTHCEQFIERDDWTGLSVWISSFGYGGDLIDDVLRKIQEVLPNKPSHHVIFGSRRVV